MINKNHQVITSRQNSSVYKFGKQINTVKYTKF